MSTFLKDGTVSFDTSPSVSGYAAAGGKNESEGPLAPSFDFLTADDTLGESSWEKAECRLQETAFSLALGKAGLNEADIDYIFAGDLMNQCVAPSYAARGTGLPFWGLYGACSTMAESLSLAGIFIDGSLGRNAAAVTSSHFCSAERQYRFPVNYSEVRTPTAQWTATAGGCCIVSAHSRPPYLKAVTTGKIKDMGVTDANNMGAAMAAAAYDTITRHLANTSKSPADFDMILTGDLGRVGSDILAELFRRDGIDIAGLHNDCGLMLYDPAKQDVHAGGSGCGCSAAVLCGFILGEIASGRLSDVLFAATGALMSPTMVQQGESIPGIAHCVHLSRN